MGRRSKEEMKMTSASGEGYSKFDKPTVKQRKFVCPKCGYHRMLNKNVSLCLCHNCDCTTMILESQLATFNKRKEQSNKMLMLN